MTIALLRSMNKVVILYSFWQKDWAQMIRVKKKMLLSFHCHQRSPINTDSWLNESFSPSPESKYTHRNMEMDLYFYSTSVDHIASKISRRCCKHHNILNSYELWTERDRLFKFGGVLCWLKIISSVCPVHSDPLWSLLCIIPYPL